MSMKHKREDGAVIVFSAITLVVLFLFGALTVDLGAAWAQRRTNQSAVDAAVMAGALEYVASGSATSAEIVDVVRDFTSRNIDIPADSSDWLACTDPEGIADGFVPMTDSDGNTIECISLKQGATGDVELLLRVNLPERQVETSFAKIIGIDTLNVGAFAIAEITSHGQFATLPFSVPANFGAEECLGTPPSGHLKDDELGACVGPDSGNFGMLDSPFFESHTLGSNTLNGCGSKPPNFNTRAPFVLAIGLDHAIQEWDVDTLGPVPFSDLGRKAPGTDTCEADTEPPEVPSVLKTQSGNRDLIQGLVGDGLYDGEVGRLRQGSGAKLHFEMIGDGDFDLDNVGLWEYLIAPTDDGSGPALPAECLSGFYGDGEAVGRDATDGIRTCLDEMRKPKYDSSTRWPEFHPDITKSPRFALIPVLAYHSGDLRGTDYRAVIKLVPVYLQTTWFDCGHGGDPWCYFEPEPSNSVPPATTSTSSTSSTTTLPPDPTADLTILFNPGEGTTDPLIMGNGNDAIVDGTPKKLELAGLTAFVLDWEWLFPDAKNQLGGTVPLAASLYR
jgi:hypothetical protein